MKDQELEDILGISADEAHGFNADATRNKIPALQAWKTRKVVEELESLSHEPQMHGDWEQVVEDRISELSKGVE